MKNSCKRRPFFQPCAQESCVLPAEFQGVCPHISSKPKPTELNCGSSPGTGHASGLNCYARGINVFLAGLFESGHVAERLKLKKLKCEERQMRTVSDAQIRTMLNCNPRRKAEHRFVTAAYIANRYGSKNKRGSNANSRIPD